MLGYVSYKFSYTLTLNIYFSVSFRFYTITIIIVEAIKNILLEKLKAFMMAEEQPGRYEENFKYVIERMQSQDEKIVLRAIKTARKMLMDKNIMNGKKTFVNLGIVPILDGFLDSNIIKKKITISSL